MIHKPKNHKFTELLTSKHKKGLKALAHYLKPVVQIGTHGISEALLQEIFISLKKHELIKLQIPANLNSEEKNILQEEIFQKLPKNTHIVSRIGRNIILFFEKSPQEASIKLADL